MASAYQAPEVSLILVPSPSYEKPGGSGLVTYSYQEPVLLNITLQNEGPGPVTVLGVPPRMGIRHIDGGDFLTWQRNNSVAILQEGESITTFLSWDQRDGNGTQVAPGIYTIGIYYLYTAGDTGGAWDLSDVHPLTETTQILIAHQNGALLKNISLHMTEKNNGVTSTLVSLDCNAKKGIASFDVEIPEKSQDVTPRPEGIVPCDVSAYPSAEYRIDQGEMRQFLDMDFTCGATPSQIHRVHLYFEPLPADAEKMEIHIHRFGKYNGSWNYSIDLSAGSLLQAGAGYPVTKAPLSWETVLLAAGSVAAGIYLKKRG